MHLLGSTILSWLNVLGWLLMSVVLWGNGQTIFGSEGVALCVVFPLAGWILICAAAAFRYTERCVRLQRCRSYPKYVAGLCRDLKAHDLETAQFALRALADHCSQPLLPTWSWPFGRWESWQFRNMRKLVAGRKSAEVVVKLRTEPAPTKEAEASTAERRPIFEPLTRGFAATVERLNDAIKDTMLDWTPDDTDHAEPAEEPLPPLDPKQFVEALRGPVEVVLSSMALTINAGPHARAVLASRERCHDVLRTFLDGALELGLSMRVEAAVMAFPVSHAAVASCDTGEWHASDPLLRGPSRTWVEKFRRMKADERDLF